MRTSSGTTRDDLSPLRRFRDFNGWSQEDLSQKLGIAKSTLAHYELGTRRIPEQVMAMLTQLGFSENWPQGAPIPGVKPARASEAVKIPLVGAVAAGTGLDEFIDGNDIWVPFECVKNVPGAVAQVVEGDSMIPFIMPGDVVIARPMKVQRDGFVYIVRTAQNESRVKQLVHKNGDWVLRSINSRYADEPCSDELIGLVTGIFREDDEGTLIKSQPKGLRPKVSFE